MFSSKPVKIPTFGDVMKETTTQTLETTIQSNIIPAANNSRILMIRECLKIHIYKDKRF